MGNNFLDFTADETALEIDYRIYFSGWPMFDFCTEQSNGLTQPLDPVLLGLPLVADISARAQRYSEVAPSS